MTLLADGDLSWAAFAMSVAGGVLAMMTLFINRRFDGKLLVLEAAQHRCETDSIKKDSEIQQLRLSIETMHQRNNVAALDRNAIRSDLDTVRSVVARHDSQVLPLIPAVEEVKQMAAELPAKVAEKLKGGGKPE